MPLTQNGEALVLETHAHRLVLPLPDWLTDDERAGETLPLVETMFSSSERQAILTITPKGETAETWRTLYAARITLEPDRALIDYRRSTMTGYARNCRPGLTGFFQLGEDRGEALAPLGFVCGAFLERLGNLIGMGEVAIISFKRTPAGIAAVYQEWRGDAFDPTDPTAWPVPTDVVELRARQLHDEAELIATGD
ncbi:hypothetical protein GCM10010862_32600 [Devosia nitrariae]|uniref:Uncharacterized protein n=2 Tax=Devosia nitrariae TaxID=2071872 RepID=A0ABQ5W7P5_9HYPH|nr:hypothetical protein GCM10010862_32600 [Devosia nitrariae]